MRWLYLVRSRRKSRTLYLDVNDNECRRRGRARTAFPLVDAPTYAADVLLSICCGEADVAVEPVADVVPVQHRRQLAVGGQRVLQRVRQSALACSPRPHPNRSSPTHTLKKSTRVSGGPFAVGRAALARRARRARLSG